MSVEKIIFLFLSEIAWASSSSTSNDFEKLKKALGGLKVASFEDVAMKFGLSGLPKAQQYGILFGVLTFVSTVAAVVVLLVAGGTFGRLAEQSKNGGKPIPPDAVKVRARRPLLLERLLDMRKWMYETNYPDQANIESDTEVSTLTKMLLNVSPKSMDTYGVLSEDAAEAAAAKRNNSKKGDSKRNSGGAGIPEGYQKNYLHAYSRCQDYPGGPLLPAYPEGRYESFARAYAGCGNHTTTNYRRSYARMYEAVTCVDRKTYEKFEKLFMSRPADIVGRSCRLEVLDKERHLEDFYQVTSGLPYEDQKSYDPNMIWAFMDYGPFGTLEEMSSSPLFKSTPGKATFAIIENLTDKLCGVVILSNDDPCNLSIDLETTIMKPKSKGTQEEVEACFLLLDRLFALGYRRISINVDAQDVVGKKLPGKMCFTQEAILLKHRIVKESNRDTIVYGLLNSDWDKGARQILFQKLHGAAALKSDLFKESKEAQLENQKKKLEDKKKWQEIKLAEEFNDGKKKQ